MHDSGMRADPLRHVTPEEIEALDRDGAVLIKGVLATEWVDLVREGLDNRYRAARPLVAGPRHAPARRPVSGLAFGGSATDRRRVSGVQDRGDTLGRPGSFLHGSAVLQARRPDTGDALAPGHLLLQRRGAQPDPRLGVARSRSAQRQHRGGARIPSLERHLPSRSRAAIPSSTPRRGPSKRGGGPRRTHARRRSPTRAGPIGAACAT